MKKDDKEIKKSGMLTSIALEYVDAQSSTVKAIAKYKEMIGLKTALSKSPIPLEEQDCPRAEKVKKYFEWFMPAWEQLSDRNQLVLMEFYGTGSTRSNANARLSTSGHPELFVGDRQIDRYREQALKQFSFLLYGSDRKFK